MNKMSGVLISLFFVVSLVSFAFAIHEEMPSETQVPLPGPDAVKLYDYVVKLNPYDGWHLWPGSERYHRGSGPHGAFVTTFVNNSGYFDVRKDGKIADGSIIVMENYNQDRKLSSLSVMYKIQGYNPDTGNWFWAEYDPFGKVLASGKVPDCLNCHGKNRQRDYIMGGR